MAIRPLKVQCVTSDRVHSDYFHIGINRFQIDHAFSRHFVYAGSAGAHASQITVGITGHLLIVPGNHRHLIILGIHFVRTTGNFRGSRAIGTRPGTLRALILLLLEFLKDDPVDELCSEPGPMRSTQASNPPRSSMGRRFNRFS